MHSPENNDMYTSASRNAAATSLAGQLLTLLLSVSTFALAAPNLAEAEVFSPANTSGQTCCQECGQNCGPRKLRMCTVMVPARVVETRVKVDVIKKQEQREETYTAFKLVPKTRKFEKEECYLKQEIKSKKITDEQCHLVDMPVERTKHVKTYHPELRELCDPRGQGPSQLCEVMVESTEPQTSVCTEKKLAISKTEREISYCVRTPQKRKIPCAEDKYYDLVPVTKTRQVTVCVPELVRTPYEVIVSKPIPKKILCCPQCAKKHSK